MKRNKGYSLIELVVAVAVLVVVLAELGALMVNGATLYERGTMEVSLQEEAQQVILQMEDLLMGATRSVVASEPKTHGSVSTDVITIETHLYDYDHDSGAATGMKKVEYVIGLEFDVCEGTPPSDANYGDKPNDHSRLMMKRTVDGGSPTYAVMAESVRAIHMHKTSTEKDIGGGSVSAMDDMTGYKNADMVVFQVEMQNHEYSYSSSKDIYLRNQPGTGGPSHDFQTQPKFRLELNVMRVHSGYSLQDAAPSADYKYFKFEDPTTYGTVYTITGDHPSEGGTELTNVYTNNPTICVNSGGLLGDWTKSVSSCVVQCSTSANFTSGDVKPIRIYTDAFEMNDMPLYARTANDSKPVRSVVPVYGVCLCSDCLKKISMECQIYAEIPSTYNGTTVDWYKTTMGLNGGIKRDRSAGDKIKNITIAKVDETDLPSTSEITITIPSSGESFEFNGGKLGDGNGKMWTQAGGKYYFSIDQYGQSNALVLLMKDQSITQGYTYWENMVKKFNGYVRVRLHCYWKKGVGDFYEEKVNFYYYPMARSDYPSTIDDAVYEKLWTHIAANYRTDDVEVDDGSGGGSGGGGGSSETAGTHPDLSVSITGDAVDNGSSYKVGPQWTGSENKDKVEQTIKVKWNGTCTNESKRLGDITVNFGKNVDYICYNPGVSGTGSSVTIHPNEWQTECEIKVSWWL
ncbi:MAG: prepilin-type N-terminal cleavage/methylation domain-containing protein [Lachnospiraceae bacterium]|nr:prepilin-type N-terminal cleavage/methylation domain-containing protein [Lachnospiraceae bacterium]